MKSKSPRTFARARNVPRDAIGCVVVLVIAFGPRNALAADVGPQPAKAKPVHSPPAKVPNAATVRPIAVRIEATVELFAPLTFGITAGYAFRPWFVLEGTAAYQFGFKHGAMGRFRIPITPSSSISTGVGVTIQWIPWNDHRGPPGLDLWLPAEVGYEYREKEGFTFLVGLGASYWLYAYRDYSGFSDSTFHQLFLENLPQLRPTARAGLGWAF